MSPTATSRRRRTSTVIRRPRSKNGSTTDEAPAPREHADEAVGRRRPRGISRSAARAGARRPARESARSSASSRGVSGIVARADVRRDALAVQVAAVGRVVVAERQVERAAVGQVEDLAEHSLAERAPADDRRAEALAAARRSRSRTRSRCRDRPARRPACASIASPVASNTRCGRLRPLVVTITPSGTNSARHEHRLVQQAAAVGAQVEHEALGAPRARGCLQLATRAARARRSMNDASCTTPSFLPPTRRSVAVDDRDRIRSRLHPQHARLAARPRRS